MKTLWEYKVISLDLAGTTMGAEVFNELGEEGWELVNFTKQSSDLYAVFKRPTDGS